MNPLANLAKMPGLTACAVFDPDSACVAHHAEAPYDAALLQGAYLELQDTIAALKARGTTTGRPIEDIFIQATDGWLALSTHGALAVLSLGQSAVNVAMLKVATNLAVKRLERPAPPATRRPATRPATRPEIAKVNPRSPTDEVGLVGLAQIRRLLTSLQGYLGAAAKSILTREMQAMRMTPTTVPVAQYATLVHRLARNIDNADWREAFLDEARR